MRLHLAAPALALLALAQPTEGMAQEKSNTVPVLLRVETSCTLNASPLSFGASPLITSGILSTATIALHCTPGLAYTISIDNGANFNGQRRMASDAGAFPFFRYVPYQVYRDPARTLVWGSGAGQNVSGVAPANGRVSHTVYGRVPAAIVIPTAYRDTLTITLDY